MDPSSFIHYRANIDDLRLRDLLSATVKVALVGSGYTPSTGTAGHSLWASVSANEIAGGYGYTTGGQALTSTALTAVTGGWGFSSDNVVWTASGGSIPNWRYAVFYVAGTLWSMTDPLLGYVVGDAAPADYPETTDGRLLTLAVPAGGWFDAVA